MFVAQLCSKQTRLALQVSSWHSRHMALALQWRIRALAPQTLCICSIPAIAAGPHGIMDMIHNFNPDDKLRGASHAVGPMIASVTGGTSSAD